MVTEYIDCGNSAESLALAITKLAGIHWRNEQTKSLIESAYAIGEVRTKSPFSAVAEDMNFFDLVEWSEFNHTYIDKNAHHKKGVGIVLHGLAEEIRRSPLHRKAVEDVLKWTETIRGHLQRDRNYFLFTYLKTLNALCQDKGVA